MINNHLLKIPVLAYHASNVFGDDYHLNDNIALKNDLASIKENGVQIISAPTLVDFLLGATNLDTNKKYVVITFDDGNNLDFISSNYRKFGPQPSFYSLLKESNQYTHATSFVIASVDSRKTMEQKCLQNQALLSDDWWQKAAQSGMFSIENHSWDHVHPELDNVKQKDNIKGDFRQINTLVDARAQIENSSDFIASKTNQKPVLFAYPFGHFNDYLVNEYFPKQQSQIKAAFTCKPKYADKNVNIWKIPRFVCGCDWKTPQQFQRLINLEL